MLYGCILSARHIILGRYMKLVIINAGPNFFSLRIAP